MWLWVAAAYRATPGWLKTSLAVGALLAVVFFAGDMRGRRIEHAKCEAAAARAQAAADAQDRHAAKELDEHDAQVVEELKLQKKADDAKINDLETRLRRQSTTSCVYDKSNSDPDPARRVRP